MTLAEAAEAASRRIRTVYPGSVRALSPTALSRIEQGQRAPTVRSLVGLAYALDFEITIDQLGVRLRERSARERPT